MKKLIIIGCICVFNFESAFAFSGPDSLQNEPGRDSSLSVRKIKDIRKRFEPKSKYNFLDYIQNQNTSAQDGNFWIGGNGIVNGNMLVGTSTDAGYKLDVNGTGRFIKDIISYNGSYLSSWQTPARFIAKYSATATEGENDYLAGFWANYSYDPYLTLAYGKTINGTTTWNPIITAGGPGTAINSYSNLRFTYAGTSELMRLTPYGNLLIGTATDAGYKLNVNGTGKFGTANLISGYVFTPTQAGIFDGEVFATGLRIGYGAPQNIAMAVNGEYNIGAFNFVSQLSGYTKLQQVANETADPDRILVWGNDNRINYMTKSQLGISGLTSVPADRMIYGTGTGITSDPKFTYDATNNDLYVRSTPGFAHAGLFLGAAFYSPTSGLRLWHDGQSGASYIESRIDGSIKYPLVINSGGQLTTIGGNLLVGTTTDWGYKLDVNGSSRIVPPTTASSLTIGGNTTAGVGLYDIIANNYTGSYFQNALYISKSNYTGGGTSTGSIVYVDAPLSSMTDGKAILELVGTRGYLKNAAIGLKSTVSLDINNINGTGYAGQFIADYSVAGSNSFAAYAVYAKALQGYNNAQAYAFYGDGGLIYNKDIPNETVDPDKILVSSSGVVKYMTKSQLGIGGNNANNSQWTTLSTNIYYNSGSVAIGTTDPQGYKLAVNGDAIFTKVKVKQYPWSDYVFNSDYKLPTLKEVEEYIKQNKHLPDVPSEKEVQKNGLDVGDNQAVLLKKIEELTLYIIEQDKKIEKLENEVQSLKKKN